MDRPWLAPFLAHVAQGATLSEAARLCGVSPSTVYRLRKDDADFQAALADAEEESVDVLEATARYRAVHGVEEPVVYQGQLTPVWELDDNGRPVLDPETGTAQQARNPDGSLKWLTVRKPSDALLMMLLRGRRKDVFAERKELTGKNGADLPPAIVISTGVPSADDDLAGIV